MESLPSGGKPLLIKEGAYQQFQGVTYNDQIKGCIRREGHVLLGGKVIPNRSMEKTYLKSQVLRVKIY